jgi:hypothetical protein
MIIGSIFTNRDSKSVDKYLLEINAIMKLNYEEEIKFAKTVKSRLKERLLGKLALVNLIHSVGLAYHLQN